MTNDRHTSINAGNHVISALSLCGHNWASLVQEQDSSATRRSPRLTGKAWGGGWEVLRQSHRGQVWERLGAGFLMEGA